MPDMRAAVNFRQLLVCATHRHEGPRAAHAARQNQAQENSMTQIVVALTLAIAALASVPVSASEETKEKDRCVLQDDSLVTPQGSPPTRTVGCDIQQDESLLDE
jgi:hypothetical protein